MTTKYISVELLSYFLVVRREKVKHLPLLEESHLEESLKRIEKVKYLALLEESLKRRKKIKESLKRREKVKHLSLLGGES
ncbi:UNVERIFIED_CONTAM: hypothetical protein Slati_1528400 [Sesamum latifolium]|uniref:Uncharacterized protein n=1 Tax=Sesamum latifolium TaxID=2727402 RepID=A0AAW2X8A1_9LAMI